MNNFENVETLKKEFNCGAFFLLGFGGYLISHAITA